MNKLDRIIANQLVMGGKPCIRGTRITVGMVLGLLAKGYSVETIMQHYPQLEDKDFPQIFAYASWRAEEMEVTLHSGR